MNQKCELESILLMTEEATLAHVSQELERYYKKEFTTDHYNYAIAQGASPIALVAHVDTVSWGTKGMALTWNKNVLSNAEGILGADDRAGVFAILEIVKHCHKHHLPMPSVIFTNHEESGGRGVKQLIKDNIFDTINTNILVELDRKGCNEYVFYTSSLPKEVKDYVESFGYIEEDGSYSDIMDLAFEYKIPAVNLSIGYYGQHTQFETLHFDEMIMNMHRVLAMIKDPIHKLYKLSESDCRSWSSYGGNSSLYSSKYSGLGSSSYDPYSYYDSYNKPRGAKVLDFKSAQEKEWPTNDDWNLGGGDNGFVYEQDEEKEDKRSGLTYLDTLKVEVYCALQDDTIHDLYGSNVDDPEVLEFLDNFFDFFNHEVYKRGYSDGEVLEEADFEEVFDVTWTLVASVYGTTL